MRKESDAEAAFYCIGGDLGEPACAWSKTHPNKEITTYDSDPQSGSGRRAGSRFPVRFGVTFEYGSVGVLLGRPGFSRQAEVRPEEIRGLLREKPIQDS